MESNWRHMVYLRRRLLLLVGSRWNLFHVEPDFFMPKNNLVLGCVLCISTVSISYIVNFSLIFLTD